MKSRCFGVTLKGDCAWLPLDCLTEGLVAPGGVPWVDCSLELPQELTPAACRDDHWGWALGGAGPGESNREPCECKLRQNDLKRLAGSGFRGFNILEDVRLSKCAQWRRC